MTQVGGPDPDIGHKSYSVWESVPCTVCVSVCMWLMLEGLLSPENVTKCGYMVLLLLFSFLPGNQDLI